MRTFLPLAAALLALSVNACSQPDDDGETAGFKPPTAQPRKDFEEAIGARFNRLDRNHDGVLEASDLPKRPERLARWDTNGDGKVPREEFRAADIARFVAADADKDDVLTSLERDRANWSGRKTAP